VQIGVLLLEVRPLPVQFEKVTRERWIARATRSVRHPFVKPDGISFLERIGQVHSCACTFNRDERSPVWFVSDGILLVIHHEDPERTSAMIFD
jgi:hypothetical protein